MLFTQQPWVPVLTFINFYVGLLSIALQGTKVWLRKVSGA